MEPKAGDAVGGEEEGVTTSGKGARSSTKAPPRPNLVPARLGRYFVVGPLATGGMAQILLAKLIGPQGFERPVVVKRILPHFALDPNFVTMFLDEARLTVSIRHANVVQVQELCQEDGELFLVMEYLNGETLLGIMRRLAADNRMLTLGLAIHVVAEACAGLHAAHESVDADGVPANLVHRDISPDNLFVTYDGEVKLLDFGIAKAAGRSTKTEAGGLKGKLAYMSPEQCRGEVLDRRSDLFSLGIVLYEIATMRRLFKRAADMLTMQAVCNDPVRAPSQLIESCPPAFDEIIARALARDREQRYPSAKAMRQDLLRLLAELPSVEPYDEQLKPLMRVLFDERIDAKSQLLRKVRLGMEVETIPESEIEGHTVPSFPDPDMAQSASKTPASSARLRWGAIAGLAAVALFVGLRVVKASLADPSQARAASVQPAPPVPALSTLVTVHIDSTPPGALVRVDGTERGIAPYDLVMPRGDARMLVELSKDGYDPQHETIRANADQIVHMALAPRMALEPTARRPHVRTAGKKPTQEPEPGKTPFVRWE